MKKLSQAQIAQKPGIINSYLSIILYGQRKYPPELNERIQSITNVHKVVNNQLQTALPKQNVESSIIFTGSNTIKTH